LGFLSGLLSNAGVVDSQELQEEYGALLADSESIEIGFIVLRDTFIFTTKRMILIDKQGLTGKKVEYMSIPYSKISKYSIETAGRFDLDAELKIWVGSDPVPIAKKFNKKVSVYDLQKVIASHIS